MIKKIHKSAVVMILMLGLLFVSAAPAAMAQGNCRTRRGYSTAYNDGRFYNGRNYDQGRYYNDRGYDRNYRGRYYEDREDTTGNLLKRTGIGAGVGALGGALIGGKKGALIGAGAGAGVGYIIHRKKIGDQRNRF